MPRPTSCGSTSRASFEGRSQNPERQRGVTWKDEGKKGVPTNIMSKISHLVLAWSLLVCTSARAEPDEEVPKLEVPKLVVLNLVAEAGIDPGKVRLLNELLLTEFQPSWLPLPSADQLRVIAERVAAGD